MNFESPKKSSLENKSLNNKEKINFSESIKQIYKIGRRTILASFFTLGLINVEHSIDTSHEDIVSIQNSFDKINSVQSEGLADDFSKILNAKELHGLMMVLNSDHDNSEIQYYKFFFNPEVRKKIISINNEFDVSFGDIISIGHSQEIQELIASDNFNKEIIPKIKELRKLFSGNNNPPAQFIDIREGFKCLDNPDYPKALSFVLDKTYKPFNGRGKHTGTNIDKIYNSSYFKKLTGILDDRNIFFNESIAECDTVSQQQEFLNFLNDEKNRKVLSLFNEQSPLGGYEMKVMVNKDNFESYWRPILEDAKFIKKLDTLEQYGFTLRNLFLMESNNVDKLIHQEDYFQGFMFFLKKESTSNSEYIIKTTESILSYYSDNKKVNLLDLEKDFDSITDSDDHLGDLNQKLLSTKWAPFNAVISRTTNKNEVNLIQFAEDPAIKNVINKMELFKNVPVCLNKFNPEEQKEWILRIARNMYISRLDPTIANFEQVFNETIRIRNNPELLEKSLFKNRNVLVFAHNEIYTNPLIKGSDRTRFGNEKTLNAIESQKTNELYVVRSSLNTPEDLQEKKGMFFDYISKNKNLTVLIAAHGSPDAIFLTQGVPDKNGKIAETGKEEYVSPNEFAMALEQRFDNGVKDVPIFIFESCYNQNYIRSLYGVIDEINSTKNKDIPYPIMCGSTEYGQLGYSEYNSNYRDMLSEAMLDGKKNTKIKDLIEIEAGAAQKGIITNVSLFVPVTEIAKEKKEVSKESIVKKKYYQIAEVDENKIQQSHIQQYAKSVLDGSLDNQTASYFEQVQPKTAKSIRELLDKKETGSTNENIS